MNVDIGSIRDADSAKTASTFAKAGCASKASSRLAQIKATPGGSARRGLPLDVSYIVSARSKPLRARGQPLHISA